MMLFALIGGAGFWVMLAGLVTGEGWLRVPGVACVVLAVACAFLIDWRASRKPLVEAEAQSFHGTVDLFGDLHDTFNDWPPSIDDRRAA